MSYYSDTSSLTISRMSKVDPSIDARPRDELTDRLIKEAFEVEEAAKRARKAAKGGELAQDVAKPQSRKRQLKSFDEIEEEEGAKAGGPVKEFLVGKANKKRAANRKQSAVGEGDVALPSVDELDRFEEDVDDAQLEEAEAFEPFNLKEERERGSFDEAGNYVDKKVEEEADAWLDSGEVKVVSAEVRRKIEARAAASAAARVAPMTERQIATIKAAISALMLPGETVTRALKRLGAAEAGTVPQRALGKRERQRLAAGAMAAANAASAGARADRGSTEAASASAAAGSRAAFLQLTDAAAQLLDEGELDVYTTTREELDRSAALYLPRAQPASSIMAGAAAENEEDMFEDDDAKPAAPAPALTEQAAPGQQDVAQPSTDTLAASGVPGAPPRPPFHADTEQQPSSSAAAAAANRIGQEDDPTVYATWPVKELKRFLLERGVDASSIVEKGDLVKRVEDLAAQGPAFGSADNSGAAFFEVPHGYAFDPTSGYFHCPETGMYFDPHSGCYSSAGKWYSYDTTTRQFVEMTGA